MHHPTEDLWQEFSADCITTFLGHNRAMQSELRMRHHKFAFACPPEADTNSRAHAIEQY